MSSELLSTSILGYMSSESQSMYPSTKITFKKVILKLTEIHKLKNKALPLQTPLIVHFKMQLQQRMRCLDLFWEEVTLISTATSRVLGQKEVEGKLDTLFRASFKQHRSIRYSSVL